MIAGVLSILSLLRVAISDALFRSSKRFKESFSDAISDVLINKKIIFLKHSPYATSK